ncbi:hypothetical protein B0H13DRAFT_1855285 [Mycena leptocephala]|nr:hypothetical protein B0H13DRAFT_1855285 [Mycena leptocephala]
MLLNRESLGQPTAKGKGMVGGGRKKSYGRRRYVDPKLRDYDAKEDTTGEPRQPKRKPTRATSQRWGRELAWTPKALKKTAGKRCQPPSAARSRCAARVRATERGPSEGGSRFRRGAIGDLRRGDGAKTECCKAAARRAEDEGVGTAGRGNSEAQRGDGLETAMGPRGAEEAQGRGGGRRSRAGGSSGATTRRRSGHGCSSAGWQTDDETSTYGWG